MRRLIPTLALTLLALIAWAGLVAADIFFGWSRTPLAARGDPRAFFEAAAQRIATQNHGNAVFVLIERGRVVDVYARSNGEPVSAETLFQVASLSKWVTAWGVMTLVEQGRLDLDAPVSNYLTRWQLPGSPYNDGVTIRRILSHTAGLTDGLGYGGFAPGTPIQSLEASLTHASDASFGANGIVRVGAEPGAGWRYSGGGYALLQLIVEEVSGEPFSDYMKHAVLTPLGMKSSTYVLDDADRARVAEFYDTDGTRATHFTFTATAAASLYTSANDLTRFLQAQGTGAQDEPPGRGVLRAETLAEMARPEATLLGMPFWGLGVALYAPNNSGAFIIGHDGGNAPAINTTAHLDPSSGDGVIVMVTGDRTLATEIGGEWTFWNVGRVDRIALRLSLSTLIKRVLIGWAAIVALAVRFAWRSSKRERHAASAAQRRTM